MSYIRKAICRIWNKSWIILRLEVSYIFVSNLWSVIINYLPISHHWTFDLIVSFFSMDLVNRAVFEACQLYQFWYRSYFDWSYISITFWLTPNGITLTKNAVKENNKSKHIRKNIKPVKSKINLIVRNHCKNV